MHELTITQNMLDMALEHAERAGAQHITHINLIVGEISGGVKGGLGRLILDFASRYTTGPERLYATVIGSAVLGIIAVGLVILAEYIVLSKRRAEAHTP